MLLFLFALIALLGKRYCRRGYRWLLGFLKIKKGRYIFHFPAHIKSVFILTPKHITKKKKSHSKTQSLSTVQNSVSLSKIFHRPSVKVRKHFPSPKAENHFLALVTHSLSKSKPKSLTHSKSKLESKTLSLKG